MPGTVTTKDAKSGEDKTENIVGHNSEEDARAAVELVNLKMKNGPSFGEFANDQESIFERLGRREGLKTLIVDHGNPEKWHGQRADKAVPCKTDEQVSRVFADVYHKVEADRAVMFRSLKASWKMSMTMVSFLRDFWVFRMP